MKYPMDEKARSEAFPVHIELGRKAEDGMNVPVPSNSGGKKGRPKIYFPTVYIDALPGLEKLPKAGCMLVDFRRTRLTIEEGAGGKDQAGVTLELRTICLPEEAEEADEVENLADAFSDPRKSGGKKSTETDDDDDGEEE